MGKMKVVLLFYKHCVRCGKINKTDELLKRHFHSYLISIKGKVDFVIKCVIKDTTEGTDLIKV